MFWRVLGSVISLFPKNRKPSFRPDSWCKNSKLFRENPILVSSRQCENAFSTGLIFCWIKILSKRYRFNKDSLKIIFFLFFACFILCFSCFLICFVTMGWFSKRWANLQTHAKLDSPQNTPNTVSKRPSNLFISVIFDDFYGFNQTFWCSIVGVFLIETHTKQ